MNTMNWMSHDLYVLCSMFLVLWPMAYSINPLKREVGFFEILTGFLATYIDIIIILSNTEKNVLIQNNKLKSLKVTQVKDEMDDDEDDGCDSV